MTTYFSTFTSGLQEIIAQALPQALPEARIQQLLDGLVIYESNRPLQQVTSLRLFNNTFIALYPVQQLPPGGLHQLLQRVMQKPNDLRIPGWAIKKARSFRLMASRENQTISIKRELLERLESFFSHRLRLRVSRSKADVEVWFIERSEGLGLVGLRVTRNPAMEKNLHKGELRPELAHCLCLLSEPQGSDVFLDPFAGSGAIPLERASHFPYRRIIAVDQEENAVTGLSRRLPRDERVQSFAADARRLTSLVDGSINKIVTDPPWGFYEERRAETITDFYGEMLAEFARLLKDDGLLVVLMGQKERFEEALAGCTGRLALLGKWDILVSGKKAAIYKARKLPAS